MANKTQPLQIEHRVYLMSPTQQAIAHAAWRSGMGNIHHTDHVNVMFSIWNHVEGHEVILKLLHNSRS